MSLWAGLIEPLTDRDTEFSATGEEKEKGGVGVRRSVERLQTKRDACNTAWSMSVPIWKWVKRPGDQDKTQEECRGRNQIAWYLTQRSHTLLMRAHQQVIFGQDNLRNMEREDNSLEGVQQPNYGLQASLSLYRGLHRLQEAKDQLEMAFHALRIREMRKEIITQTSQARKQTKERAYKEAWEGIQPTVELVEGKCHPLTMIQNWGHQKMMLNLTRIIKEVMRKADQQIKSGVAYLRREQLARETEGQNRTEYHPLASLLLYRGLC